MNFFGPRSLWDTAPHFVDAISSVLQGAGTSAAVGNVVGDVVEGGVAGGGLAALSGRNPLTGAMIGGAGGAALGAYNNWSDLTATPVDPSLLDSNGNPITPPIPPQTDSTTGQPIYDTAGNLVSNNGASGGQAAASAGTVAGQAATNAGSGGGLTGGPSGGINKTSLALGALSAISSALNKPQMGKYATPGPSSTTQGAFYNTPLNSANAPGRTYTPPNYPTGAQPNYWQYGGPEQTYFGNNSLAAYGFAHGGAAPEAGEWMAAQDGNHVKGPGTGTSDSIPAQLSNGEYILTARDVARIGGGSNERGARILDQDRAALAKIVREPQFVSRTNGPLGSVKRRAN